MHAERYDGGLFEVSRRQLNELDNFVYWCNEQIQLATEANSYDH